jgi:GH43 family beta-xylosidase
MLNGALFCSPKHAKWCAPYRLLSGVIMNLYEDPLHTMMIFRFGSIKGRQMNRCRWKLIPLFVCLFTGTVFAQHAVEETYTNPIIANGQDPWVVEHGGQYFYCYSAGRDIRVRRAAELHQIGGGDETVIWTAPDDGLYSQNVWAPEMHLIGGRWYIYFAADDGENQNHRMYVLRSEGEDAAGPYAFVGKVSDGADRWAIDGTVYQGPGGGLYFIWSGWPGDENGRQNLYIAPMSDPVTIAEPGVLISEPTLDWESASEPRVNEGPQVLVRGGKVHVIFSAGGSWTDDYCLGRLTLVRDSPLEPGAWAKHPEPVFKKTADVFGPGHASFIHMQDGGDRSDWIVYHAAKSKGSGWVRDIRLQPFQWDADDNPDFGEPISTGVPVVVPGIKENNRR